MNSISFCRIEKFNLIPWNLSNICVIKNYNSGSGMMGEEGLIVKRERSGNIGLMWTHYCIILTVIEQSI